MPDDTGAADAQGAGAAQPQGGAAQAQGADAQQAQGASAGGSGPTSAELQAKVAELERDNAKYREAQRKREAAEQASADAKRTEQERIAELERKLQDSERRDQERAVDARITEAARALGFRNPELATRLIDRSSLDVDDGRIRNVDSLLRKLLEREPYLARPAGDFGGGPRGTPAGSGNDVNAAIRRAAGRPG